MFVSADSYDRCAHAADPNPTAEAQVKVSYPVVVDGHPIFEIHETLGANPAEERATRISASLQRLVNDPSLDLNLLHTEDESYGTKIMFADDLVMVVTATDTRRSGLSTR